MKAIAEIPRVEPLYNFSQIIYEESESTYNQVTQ